MAAPASDPRAAVVSRSQLLSATELKKWRDGLLGKMAPATINRLCRCLCACTGTGDAARRADSEPAGMGNRTGRLCRMRRRRATLSYRTTRFANSSPPPMSLMHKFGLLADVLAVTGARPSQAVRLRVEDLHDHPVRPKLMMPRSAKGGGRNRSQKRHERYSVPITAQLAAKLRAAGEAAPTMRSCSCRATAGRGATIPARTIIASRQGRYRHRTRSCR